MSLGDLENCDGHPGINDKQEFNTWVRPTQKKSKAVVRAC